MFNYAPFQPVFQISVENIINESELQQSTQILEPESSNDVDQMKLQSCRELMFNKTDTQDQSLSLNDLTNDEKDERASSKEKLVNPVVKKNNSGRPKKSKAIFSISSQVIQYLNTSVSFLLLRLGSTQSVI